MKIKRMITLLLCCILLFSLQYGVAETTIVAGRNVPEYVVVIPSKDNHDVLIRALAQEIIRYVEAQTGVVWDIVTDDEQPEGILEVRIGAVDRVKTDILSEKLTENGFRIYCDDDGNVSIIGGNIFALGMQSIYLWQMV